MNGRAQISMNITDYRATSDADGVCAGAGVGRGVHGSADRGRGVDWINSEDAFEPDSDWVRQTSGLDPEAKVLERKLQAPLSWPAR